jgi:hypothetical protein
MDDVSVIGATQIIEPFVIKRAISTLMSNVVVPEAFVAVTVCMLDCCAAVGVPVIAPELLLIARPVGSAGEIEYIAVPPVFVAVTFAVLSTVITRDARLC